MSQLTQYQDQAPNLVIDSYEDTSTDTTNLVINPQAFAQMSLFAEMMAKSKSMIPEHMRGNVGDCLAICMQAMQWGMNPFAVAQKTFNIKGVLGYEAQLVNAVITSRAPTTGRLQIEWFGEWERILGKFTEKTSKFKDSNGNDKTYKAPAWNAKDEEGLGVKVWATLIGEDKPRELTLLMSQALTRNSTLWTEDPKQQIAYLAIKRWARLHCPDVILGVYTPDELDNRGNTSPKDVTPKVKNAGASALLDRVKAKKFEAEPVYFDTSELLGTIDQINDIKQVAPIGKQIKAMVDDKNINIRDEDVDSLRDALTAKKHSIEYQNIMASIQSCKTLDDVERMRGVIEDKSGDFAQPDLHLLSDTLDMVAEEIGAEG